MTDPRPWARGKTAQEILEIGALAVDTVQSLANRPAHQAAPPAQAPMTVGDDDVVTGREVKAMMSAMADSFATPLNEIGTNAAHANMASLRQQNPKVFEKYGPEIEALVARIPVPQRNLDNLNHIINIVRGNHVQDLAREMAQDMVSQGDPTLRSNGSSGTNHSYTPTATGRVTDSDELPADYRKILQDKGITEETVREFCASQNISVSQWFEKAKKHQASIITERSRRGN